MMLDQSMLLIVQISVIQTYNVRMEVTRTPGTVLSVFVRICTLEHSVRKLHHLDLQDVSP